MSSGLFKKSCYRGRYLHNTQQTQQTNIHALNEIRIRKPKNELPQPYAVGRTVTGIGFWLKDAVYFTNFVEVENPGINYWVSLFRWQ